MSNIISGEATLWFAPMGTKIPNKDESFEDAGWVLVEDAFDITFEERVPQNEVQVYDYRSLLNKTFTITAKFTPTPEFWGILVGIQLRYGLRELHRNLGRYCQWPYTN